MSEAKFVIPGGEYVVPKAVENHKKVHLSVLEAKQDAKEVFQKLYEEFGSFQNMFEGIDTLTKTILVKECDSLVERWLAANGVYDENADTIIKKYIPSLSIVKELDKLDDWRLRQAQNVEIQRELIEERKQNRARYSGGGIGLRGAITGMAAAGVMNSVSAGISSLGASFQKSQLERDYSKLLSSKYRDADTRNGFIRAILADISRFEEGLLQVLRNTGLGIHKYDTADIKKVETICSNMKLGRIPDSERINVYRAMIGMDPFNRNIYVQMLQDYPDYAEGIIQIARFFGFSLREEIEQMIQSAFTKSCKEAAVEGKDLQQQEEYYKLAKQQTCALMSKYDVRKSETLNAIDSKLKEIDTQMRTYDGAEYETRQLCAQAKADHAELEEKYKASLGDRAKLVALLEHIQANSAYTAKYSAQYAERIQLDIQKIDQDASIKEIEALFKAIDVKEDTEDLSKLSEAYDKIQRLNVDENTRKAYMNRLRKQYVQAESGQIAQKMLKIYQKVDAESIGSIKATIKEIQEICPERYSSLLDEFKPIFEIMSDQKRFLYALRVNKRLGHALKSSIVFLVLAVVLFFSMIILNGLTDSTTVSYICIGGIFASFFCGGLALKYFIDLFEGRNKRAIKDLETLTFNNKIHLKHME